MKEYKKAKTDIVRIQFGTGHSMSFTDTTVDQVLDIAKKVFSEVRINRTVKLKDWCPMKAPSTKMGIVIYVRAEGGSYRKNGYKGPSKNKTIYGLGGAEAMEIFENNYKKFITS